MNIDELNKLDLFTFFFFFFYLLANLIVTSLEHKLSQVVHKSHETKIKMDIFVLIIIFIKNQQ